MTVGAGLPPRARRRGRRTLGAPCALAAGVLLTATAHAAGAPFAYIANQDSDNVTPIDVATNTAGTPIDVGSEPTGVAITPDGATAYVANEGGDNVTPIDIATNTAGAPIDVGDGPFGVAITADGATAYVINFDDDDVTPIDVATNTAGTPIDVGDGPRGVAITPDGTAYVTNQLSNDVTPIDVATNTAGAPIDVGDAPEGVAITPDGATAHVANINDDNVTPIDIATNTGGTPIDVGAFPQGVAITPDGATAYVTNRFSNDVTPIDLATNTAGTPIGVGNGPIGVAITPTIEAIPDRAAIDLGSRDVGAGPSGPQTVTIESTGTGNLTPGAASLTGANAGDFAITSDTCAGATLQPSQACAIGVAFDPGSVSTKSASLQIPSNDPGSPTQVALSGTGTVPPPPPPAPIVPPPPAPNTAESVCAPVPPRRTSDKDRIRLTKQALAIQQRIDAAALRRLNAANVWIDRGIVPSDLCAYGFGASGFQGGIAWVGGGPVGPATVPDPRALGIIKRNKPPANFTLSRVQVQINERISAALLARAIATTRRMRELTGGNLAPGAQLGPRERYPGLVPGAPLPPSITPEPRELTIGTPRRRNVTLTAAQLRRTQRQSQRAIILANLVNDTIRAGLTEEQFSPGSVGAQRVG